MKVAMTGAAHGIGAATAAKLKAQGAHITGFDIAEPVSHVDRWIEVDMSDPEAILAAAGRAEGPFDVLVNCAGLPPRPGLVEKILAVNAFGLIAMTEALMPELATGSSIVSVASKAGARWKENIAQVKALLALPGPRALPAFIAEQGIDPVRAYDLSKETVIAWSVGQVEPLIARDIRINTVSPAAVETRILDDFVNAFGERATAMMARTRRSGQPEEVAEVVAFLAGPQSSWVKGVDIPVDGGTTALLAADALGLGH